MIHPFANGSAYMAWDERNCCNCKRYDRCQLQNELTFATMTLTGEISDDIARRAGLPGDVCLEIEAEIA